MPTRSVLSILQNATPVFAEPDQSVLDVATRMIRNTESAALVVKNNKTLGIVTERDLISRVLLVGRDAESVPIGKIMTRGTITVRSDALFGQALYLMHEYNVNHIAVVDEGRPIGVVTKEDASPADVKDYAVDAEMLDHIIQVL